MDMSPFNGTVDFAMQQARAAAQDAGRLSKTAEEFTGMFMSEMMSVMFEGVGDDPMFGGGQGEKMFRGLLTQEYGKSLAKGTGTGIASEIQKMMLKIQEEQQNKG
ncbi:MAG TPA: rod-binding protein [Patescibacteria group bacterium]|nr:rod-binding protein [Patescibacteria group bacterium]